MSTKEDPKAATAAMLSDEVIDRMRKHWVFLFNGHPAPTKDEAYHHGLLDALKAVDAKIGSGELASKRITDLLVKGMNGCGDAEGVWFGLEKSEEKELQDWMDARDKTIEG